MEGRSRRALHVNFYERKKHTHPNLMVDLGQDRADEYSPKIVGHGRKAAVAIWSPNPPILAEHRDRDSRDLCRLDPQLRSFVTPTPGVGAEADGLGGMFDGLPLIGHPMLRRPRTSQQ